MRQSLRSLLQSLWEYIPALGHWGWVVLVDIVSGLTGAYLDISGTWGFPTWLWLTLLLLGLLVAPFMAFHKLRLKYSALVETLPSIEAKLQHDMLQGVYIDITNMGAKGEFKAQVEILDSDDLDSKIAQITSWRRFPGLWEGKSTESIYLMKDESHRIKLVTFEQSQKGNIRWLRLYKVNPDSAINNELYIDTYSYPILSPQGFMIPGLHMKITIASHPTAKEGTRVIECKVKANGEVLK